MSKQGCVINLGPLSAAEAYTVQHPWPSDCYVQAGDRGIVFTDRTMEEALLDPAKAITDGLSGHKGTHRTAFFEAFPRDPDTFIRCQGATIAEAEDKAWKKYQYYAACSHENGYEARGYKNGLGFCVDCGMSKTGVIEPTDNCVVCGVPTWFSVDSDGAYYCEAHAAEKPREKWTQMDYLIARMEHGNDE